MAQRTLVAVTAVLLFAAPLPSLRVSAAPIADDAPAAADVRLLPTDVAGLELPRGDRFNDADLALSITPPAGWVQSPVTALNPLSDPPEPVQESARFQVRVQDAQLYATPMPITSGLVADAGALISIGVARVGSDILALERRERGSRELGSTPGFTVLEDEATYDGLHVLTRYLFSRETDRVLVLRAAAPETSWTALEAILRASIATFSGDPRGANAPAPPAPPPPPAPEPAPAEPAPDPTAFIRERILERAATLLGLRYVWGGNSTTAGMDCSAYVSWVWGVPRYTTDSIWNVSFPISKDALRAGDALNLTIGRDPARKGHIRIFEAWANAEHTAMWVFEETPPRVVHRVIAYDDRYQPIRLAGLSSAGEVRLIPGTPAPSVRPTPVPTRRPVATRTPVRTPTPSNRRLASPTPLRTPVPTVRPAPTPVPTRTPIPPDDGP